MRTSMAFSKRTISPRLGSATLLVALLLSLLNVPVASASDLPSISVGDATLAEGDSGTANLEFPVTRTGDTTATVVVGYTTADGTAHAGTDYTAQTGTVTIPSGSSSATISVPVIGNTLLQGDRSFGIQLTGVVNAYGPPVTFASQQAFTTGSNAEAVVAGDFNGDGKTDLAIVNNESSTISVLLNATSPGAAAAAFAAKQDFATGDYPKSVAVGDFNGDGNLDLVTANIGDDNVSVLLNTTASGAAVPSFATKQDFATGSLPYSVAVGDFNGDGKPDLASANLNSYTVSVFLNTTSPGAATPTFSAKQDFATGFVPASVAVSDINGDGKLDLVTANSSPDTVSVLLNTTIPGATTPTFAAKHDFGAGTNSCSVAVGDFNGDGKPDLVTANTDANTVSVLMNTTPTGAAAPTFAIKQDFGTGSYPWSVSVSDFNGDGKPDLAVANNSDNNVSVLLNTTTPGAAAPTFATKQDFPIADFTGAVAASDFNGDGKPDLAIANQISNTATVLLNTTDLGAATPVFAPKQDFGTGDNPESVAVSDFNGDGKPDLAIVNKSSDNVSVLLNTTTPGAVAPAFAAKQDFGTGDDPISVAVGDFNGDGKPDLAVTNFSSHTLSVLLNATAPGAATPAFATKQDFGSGTYPHHVAAGDFNGDGKLDLAATNYIDNVISILLNATIPGASTAAFAAKQSFGTDSTPNALAVKDFNGDGKPDLVSSNEGSRTASVMLNATAAGASTPAFGTRQSFGADYYPLSVAARDFNGDGKPDLATANNFSNTVSVLLNTTSPGAVTPTFTIKQSFGTGSDPTSVAVSDFNRDGKPDLAAANTSSDTVSVLLNSTTLGASTPAFATKQDFDTGSDPVCVAVSDFNGDGKPDLAVANYSSSTVSVLLSLEAVITSGTATGTIEDDDAPASITKAAGDNQSARINTAFATALVVEVQNAAGHLVQGADVTFAAPASGASGAFASAAMVTTGADGRATAPELSANGTVGLYTVTASAAGGALAVQFSLTNVQWETTTSILAAPEPSIYPQPYTVTFTVAPVGAGVGTPTGNVVVSDGTHECTATVAAGSCSLSSTPAGANTLTATYAGDASYGGSTGTASHEVGKATPGVVLTVSPSPVTAREPLTLTATVTPADGDIAPMTGMVVFLDGSTALGMAQLTDTGSGFAVEITLSNLAVGDHSLSASYGGSENYQAGSSSAVQLRVLRKYPLAVYLPLIEK